MKKYKILSITTQLLSFPDTILASLQLPSGNTHQLRKSLTFLQIMRVCNKFFLNPVDGRAVSPRGSHVRGRSDSQSLHLLAQPVNMNGKKRVLDIFLIKWTFPTQKTV